MRQKKPDFDCLLFPAKYYLCPAFFFPEVGMYGNMFLFLMQMNECNTLYMLYVKVCIQGIIQPSRNTLLISNPKFSYA